MRRLAGHLLTLGIAVAVWQGGATLSASGSGEFMAAKIVIVPEDIIATEGNTLILTCVAHGTPNPEVGWLKDGMNLVNDSRVFIYNECIEVDGLWFVQSILEICDLDVQADTGNYSCQATNGGDMSYTETRSFSVVVEPREKVEIVIHPESGVYEVGNTVILTCVGFGSRYNPSVTWNREGVTIDNTSTVRVYHEVVVVGGKQFVLSNLELCGISMDDAGLYSCSASLSSGLNVSSYFWVNVTDVAPVIVIAPPDVEVSEGNTVLLTCVARGAPSPEVFWTFNGVILSNYTDNETSVYSEDLYEGGEIFVSSILEICSVDASDMGEYMCVARQGNRNVSVSFDLDVVDIAQPAEIVIAPRSTSVTVGDTILFSCVARGYPLPNITWYDQMGTLANDSRVKIYNLPLYEGGHYFLHSVLEICSVELEDGGIYSCFANNSAGTSKSYFTVEVNDESEPQIVIAPSDVTVRENNTVLFTCVACGDVRPPLISWIGNNGEKLYNDSRITVYTDVIEESGVAFVRSILELCSAEAYDEGEYSCVASSRYNPSRNTSAQFYVDVVTLQDEVDIVIAPSSTIVKENDTVLLTCVVFGDPLPTTITWTVSHDNYTDYLNNNSRVTIYQRVVEIDGTLFLQSILELCSVQTDYSGNYTCSAESSAGYDSASFELIVEPLGPPTIIIAPPSDVTVFVEETVLFTCVAIGYPLPTLSWYRTGTGMQIRNGTGDRRYVTRELTFTERGMEFSMSILEICSAEFDDAGEYSCIANSSTGYDMVRFNLSVIPQLEPPTILIAPSEETEVDIGATVIFTCVASGNPTPYISWYQWDQMLTNDSRVVILNDPIIHNGTVVSRSILQICGVQGDDEGMFRCVARNDLNTTSSSFYLDVLEPPVLAIIPSDTTAAYGTTVLLTCVAYGNEDENPTITWLMGSEPLNSSDYVRVYTDIVTESGVNFTRSILELCSVTFEAEGDYSCVASDAVGNASASFTVTVFTEVDIVVISDNTEIYAGSTGIFTCVAEGIPSPYLHWKVNGEYLKENDRIKISIWNETINNTLFITSLLEICNVDINDTAEYVCVASVPEQNDTASFYLTVLTMAPEIVVPPTDVTVVNGTDVQLTCQAEGAPRPVVTWSVGDSGSGSPVAKRSVGYGDIESGVTSTAIGETTVNSTLDLRPATVTKDYVCTADNYLGTDSATATVTVQFPLEVETDPSDLTVIVGETATFTCAFSGFPAPDRIQWFREGVDDPLTDDKFNITYDDYGLSSQISFMTVLEDHDTAYYCRAMQYLVGGRIENATTGSATLTVNSPPVLSSDFENNAFNGTLNGTFILKFTISEDQPPVPDDNITWTFLPSTAPEVSYPTVINSSTSERYNFSYEDSMVRLRIHPVRQEDEGNYTVSVSNIVGSDEDFVVVDVVIGAYITDPPEDTTVHVGEDAFFRCVATSEPPHTVIWQFNNMTLMNGTKYVITEVDSSISELRVLNVTGADDGYYMCNVQNDHGVDMDEARLTVIMTPLVTAVTESPVITLAGEGVSITLTFTVESLPPVEVVASDWRVWNDHGGHTMAPEDPRFTFSDNFLSLTIEDVAVTDEGTYNLTVTNGADLTGSASIVVDVQFVPVITTPPEDVNTSLGQNSTFTCAATGEPTPVITWTFNEVTLNTSNKYTVSGGMLVVHSVTEDDNGSYICVATNVHGSDTASAFLQLQPLSVPVVVANVPDPVGLLDTSISLSVSISQDFPRVMPSDIRWYFYPTEKVSDGSGSGGSAEGGSTEEGSAEGGSAEEGSAEGGSTESMGKEISEGEFSNDRRTLTLSSLEYGDEGIYTVVVENLAGEDYTQMCLDVQAAPIVEMTPSAIREHEGGITVFNCTVIAEPEPDVTFQFGGVTITSGGRHTITSYPGSKYYIVIYILEIVDLMTSDAGEYVCMASNTHGSDMDESTLEVLVEPEITPNQTLYQFIRDERNVSIGFYSSEREYPPLHPSNITWWFRDMDGVVSEVQNDNGRQLSEDRLTLTFSSVMPSHSGTYWIKAVNDAGTTVSPNITVEVFVEPEITPNQTLYQFFRDERNVSIGFYSSEQEYPPLHPSDITWWFRNTDGVVSEVQNDNGRQLSEDRLTLTFLSVMPSHNGTYWIVVVNDAGTTVSPNITVEVFVEPEITPEQTLYQFIRGEQNVSITFISSEREHPPLPPSNITWWFRNTAGNVSEVQNDNGRQLSEDRLMLTFSYVMLSHSGTYWIVAVNDAGTTVSPNITVEVFVNPEVYSVGDLERTVEEGTASVTFQCNATGNPSPTFTWRKDGQFLLTSIARFEVRQTPPEVDDEGRCPGYVCSTTESLTFVNVTLDDAGTYTCVASIGLRLPAADNAVLMPPYFLNVTERFVDYCAINPCENNGTCTVVGDGRKCVCPLNFIGEDCENRAEVLSPPKFIVHPISIFVGLLDIALFTCEVEGNPQPDIQWFRDNEVLEDEVRQILVILNVGPDDRGEYKCNATNSEGTIESEFVILNVQGIQQFLLVISFGSISQGRRKRQTSDAEELVNMLNEQLTGTKIGNATVYSVAIQEGFDINSNSSDVPLIFTFYAEDDGTDDGEPGEEPPTGPSVEVNFDVAEIERVVEEDVMLAAMDLGLDVTVMEFMRFDGCPTETTELDSYFNLFLNWSESSIGDVIEVNCPCEVFDLRRVAKRECGGDFINGGAWNNPLTAECDFTNTTKQLCSSPQLSDIDDIIEDGGNLDHFTVAVVTQLIENIVGASSGDNTSENDMVFDVIEGLLDNTNSTQLTIGHREFNTSGRLLSAVEVVADSYPISEVLTVTRNTFGFLLSSSTNDVTFSAALGESLTISDSSLSLSDVEGATARIELTGLSGVTDLVFGVYTTRDLFIRREEYIEANNQSNYIVGSSVVLSASYRGMYTREALFTLEKTPAAAENGTRTDCAFWDQSLDDGYGAWSTDGCRLVSESKTEAVCACNHLTQFALLVEFTRFDTCQRTATVFDSFILNWSETPIGDVIEVDCPCEALNLKRVATRECGGDLISGADWNDPLTATCNFTGIIRELCSSPQLSDIDDIIEDEENLDHLTVALVTQLIENIAGNNTSENNMVFDVIEGLLDNTNSTQLTVGQREFNTSGRLLSAIRVVADSYLITEVQTVTRNTFGFLLSPPINDVTFSADLGESLTISGSGLSLSDVEGATAKIELNELSGTSELVFGVYTTRDLFIRREEYIKANNRSSYVLGSLVVLSTHYVGIPRRALLNEARFTLRKTPAASENGTKTECSFWDQSLDNGYGAWSTDGCRLVSENRREAVCACDHLTQFALLVDLTPVDEAEDEDDSIGVGSYVGGLVCIIFLIIILITYFGSEDLRTTIGGIALINFSICLGCLFISYVISYYTTESDWACTIFSAVFHYLFLVTSIALSLLAILIVWQPERVKYIFPISLVVQLGAPLIVVIVSAAPDRDNYINDEFCRPQQEAFWYGLLLLAGMLHIFIWCIMMSGLCLVQVHREKYAGSWFEEWLGIALTILFFELAWGFGLPATNSLDLGATRLVFQIVFLVLCILLGLVMFIFFVLVPMEGRDIWRSWFSRLIPGRSGEYYTDHTNDIEENMYVTGGGMSMSEMSKGAAKRGIGVEVMKERGDDPEHIINPVAAEHDEDGEEGSGQVYESKEEKMDIGMLDEDDDMAKDTRL